MVPYWYKLDIVYVVLAIYLCPRDPAAHEQNTCELQWFTNFVAIVLAIAYLLLRYTRRQAREMLLRSVSSVKLICTAVCKKTSEDSGGA